MLRDIEVHNTAPKFYQFLETEVRGLLQEVKLGLSGAEPSGEFMM
jgi:hypothetical protein